MVNIGMRAHDVTAANITELAQKLEALGIRSVQLALLKSVPDIDLSQGAFSPGLARFIKTELDRRNIHIAVLGCYINPVHPDPEERARQLARFREHILYAKYLGVDMIGTETGSVNADFSFSPRNRSEENYQDFLSVMRSLTEYAASNGVTIGIEGVSTLTVYSPERMERFLSDIDMPNVRVIFDPVNYLDIDNYKNQREIIKESFERFGDYIAAVHIKDFTPVEGALRYALPLDGQLDFPFLFDLLKRKKPYVDLLLEEVKEHDVARIRAKLLEL